jgi:hypothetical protein
MDLISTAAGHLPPLPRPTSPWQRWVQGPHDPPLWIGGTNSAIGDRTLADPNAGEDS